MLDSIKTFYATHKMYVNIALVVLAVFSAWKLFKK
jgi:hypothetical protein